MARTHNRRSGPPARTAWSGSSRGSPADISGARDLRSSLVDGVEPALEERGQERVDHLGMRPADVMRTALDGDHLDLVDQVGEPPRGRLEGQDPVLGAV